jgi:thiamine pyrophosphokinase
MNELMIHRGIGKRIDHVLVNAQPLRRFKRFIDVLV